VCVRAVSWLLWRFSLRTLPIATTLVAVMLGLITHALKSRDVSAIEELVENAV